jgi:hypothetical protein
MKLNRGSVDVPRRSAQQIQLRVAMWSIPPVPPCWREASQVGLRTVGFGSLLMAPSSHYDSKVAKAVLDSVGDSVVTQPS